MSNPTLGHYKLSIVDENIRASAEHLVVTVNPVYTCLYMLYLRQVICESSVSKMHSVYTLFLFRELEGQFLSRLNVYASITNNKVLKCISSVDISHLVASQPLPPTASPTTASPPTDDLCGSAKCENDGVCVVDNGVKAVCRYM